MARLSAIIAETKADEASPFPHAGLALRARSTRLVGARAGARRRGRLPRLCCARAAPRDRAAGRTLIGPQASDLVVRHAAKGIPAEQGSTGEQKALLIGLVLAHARLVAAMSGLSRRWSCSTRSPPISTRAGAERSMQGLTELGCQVWMTGADPALFGDLPAGAQRFMVEPGRITGA